MLISIIIFAFIAAGGGALTYRFAAERSIMWRLAAGSVIGSSIFGLIAFVAACLIGFNAVTIVASILITMLPLLLLRGPGTAKQFRTEWDRAKGKLEGASARKFAPFLYYAFFFILFWLFFGRTMFEAAGAITTGGSQNLGDLPYHLGAIFSFTEANNFPPQNPSWAGARFSYPFIADFLSACFVKLGVAVATAMFVQNLVWAFSLVVILERFVADITGSKLAGRIAPALLFFTGGLGFLWFLNDATTAAKGVSDFIWNLPRDYTIGDKFRWGNSLVVLFMTQRSLLIGMPLTIVILGHLWKIFHDDEGVMPGGEKRVEITEPGPALFTLERFTSASFVVGLLAGLLPLVHLHSLAVLFVVTAFLFAFRPDKWREWVTFGAGVAILAIPELLFSLSGTATDSTKFLAWHFGWDKRDDNVLWFWIRNTGIALPLVAAGIYIWLTRAAAINIDATNLERKDKVVKDSSQRRPRDLIRFYLPFVFLFVIANIAKLAPWEWDNIKILIYWWIGSIPFIAIAIVWLWRRGTAGRIAAGAAISILVFAGAIDVFRTISNQINYGVFDADAVKVSDMIKQRVAANALFLNAPTYNSAVVLSGRQSLMRYSGHLSSHGIDYGAREAEVKQIYTGGGVADVLLKKYNVDYVLVSPLERNDLKANEDFFRKYPLVAESGQYRVYKVR